MGASIKEVHALIIGIVLVLAFAQGQARKDDKHAGCARIECIQPPSNLKCTQAFENNTKSGAIFPNSRTAKCCPLWECGEKNKWGGKHEIFTFHGQKGKQPSGDTETVRYQSAKTGKGKRVYTVDSVSTNNHDSTAVASDSKVSRKDIMKEMEKSFQSYGLKMH